MAVRDGEPYLAEAIDSILEQSVPPREVVIVDDGSHDGTPEVLRSFGDHVRVLRQPPTGQYAAMNAGIRASSAPVLAFLDADDVFTDGSLAVRLDRLADPDRPDAVFGRTEQFVSPELAPHEAARLRVDPRPQLVELFQAMVIRRSVFERVGPLDEQLRTSSNIDWISRARALGVARVAVDAVVVRRRLHRANAGLTDMAERNRDLLEVIRAHRQRTTGRK